MMFGFSWGSKVQREYTKVPAYCSVYLRFSALKDPKVGGWFYVISGENARDHRLATPHESIFEH